MLPSLSCAESEHPTRQNTWVCLTFFLITLHPAAVQRTGNVNWLLTPVSLTFYPMMGRAAEVSEYPPVSPLTIVPPAGSQRSRREQNKFPSIPHYRSTRGSQRSGRGRNKLSSIPAIVLPAGSQRSGRGDHASHPPHEVHRLSHPNPACPTRGSRHRPAWAHHPQA